MTIVLRMLDRRGDWSDPRLLWAVGGVAIAVRAGAALVFKQPLESDALAYFTMARNLAEQGVLADHFGQHAFYSAGYPILLAPAFLLFGATVAVAIGVNCGLAAVSLWLVQRIALLVSDNRAAGLIAAAGYALWLPAIWTATGIGKENLSTPLLLALAYCALQIGRSLSSGRWALDAGLVWAASLLTGGSSALLCAGVAVALIQLWRRGRHFAPVFGVGLSFMVGAAILLAPWFYATDRMIGQPVLTTNAAFNLYIGNNPAATGRFVSMRDTPLGTARWNQIRAERGEAGAAAFLQAEAVDWIVDQPVAAARLAARKLLYFWQPNIPDDADFRASGLLSAIRLIEVGQYAIILFAGIAAFRTRMIGRDDKWTVGVMIAGFWLIHAAAYIIARYRDPVIPLVIAMGSVPIAHWLHRATATRADRHGV